MHQLAPTGKRPGFPASAVLGFQLAKMMSRNKFKHLMKDCVTMGHSPKSPFCLMSYGLTHSNRFREFSDFFKSVNRTALPIDRIISVIVMASLSLVNRDYVATLATAVQK